MAFYMKGAIKVKIYCRKWVLDNIIPG